MYIHPQDQRYFHRLPFELADAALGQLRPIRDTHAVHLLRERAGPRVA